MGSSFRAKPGFLLADGAGGIGCAANEERDVLIILDLCVEKRFRFG